MQRETERSFFPLFLPLLSLYFSQIAAQGEGEERDADVADEEEGAKDEDGANEEDERVEGVWGRGARGDEERDEKRTLRRGGGGREQYHGRGRRARGGWRRVA